MSKWLALLMLPCLGVAAWLFTPATDRRPTTPAVSSKSRTERAHESAAKEPTTFTRSVPPTSDHLRLADELLAAGKTVELNVELINWFRSDAERARDWLDRREDFAPFQPALKMISEELAVSGEPAAALEWIPLLDDPQLREETLFSVMAAGRRNGRFTDAEVRAAALPQARIDQLLSGASDD